MMNSVFFSAGFLENPEMAKHTQVEFNGAHDNSMGWQTHKMGCTMMYCMTG
jgi:hypothetical protein